MAPLVVGLIAFLFAAGASVFLWLIFHPPDQWVTVDSQLVKRRLLGYRGDEADLNCIIVIQRNERTDEEEAWVTDHHNRRTRMVLEKAKEIIASCKQEYSQ